MIGEPQMALLAGRRCQRCGALVFHNSLLFAGLCDALIQEKSETFCRLAETYPAELVQCFRCRQTDRMHLANAAKRKTK